MSNAQKIIEKFEYLASEMEDLKLMCQELLQDNNYKAMTELPFETYPENLPVATYVDQVKAVEKLNADNAHGHNDWVIPTLEQVRIQYANKDSVNGDKFITESSGSDYPGWYWSSTELRDYPSLVWFVRLSDGNEDWFLKGSCRLSCRPVRLVAAPGS